VSLVSLADAQSRVGDAVDQDLIDEVEEELTRLIGPLIGERTETFYVSDRRCKDRVDGLYLSRYTDSAVVVHDTTTLTATTDYRLLDHYLVERNPESETSWFEDMTATYTPNDEEQVRSVIFDWLTYRQTPTGIQSIRIGSYSETYFPAGSGGTKQSADPVVRGFLRRILPSSGLGPLREPFRYYATRRDRTLITSTGS
jgi:hypothetical protein